MNDEELIKQAIGVRIVPLYKVPGTYYYNEWENLDDNAESFGEDREIGDTSERYYLGPVRKYQSTDDEEIIKKAIEKLNSKSFSIGESVIMPDDQVGTIVDFSGANARVLLSDDNRKFVCEITKLKECK